MMLRVNEDHVLRELMDALQEHAAARNSLWGLGLSDRENNSPLYAARLDRFERTIKRVCEAMRIAEEMAKPRKSRLRSGEAEGADTNKMSFLYGRNLISSEEFVVLLGNTPS